MTPGDRPRSPGSSDPGIALAVVPAAGRAERFGGGKLLADVAGAPLLERTLRSLLDGGVGHAVVVLAPDDTAIPEHVPLMRDPRVTPVVNPEPARGMFSSIQTGVAAAALAGGDVLLVLPADMPFVRANTVRAVIAEARRLAGHVVVPRHAGRRGHPIAIPATLRAAVLAAPADSNLKAGLVGAPRLELDVDDDGVVRDVDVPGDLPLK